MSKAGELLREVRSKAGFAASRPAFLTQYKELNWGQDPEVLRNWEDGRVLFKEEQVLDLLRVGLVKHGTDEHRALLEAIMFDERERLRLNSLRVLANNQEASEEPEAYFAPPKSEAAVNQDNGQTQTVVCKAGHSGTDKKVFWYLDEHYLGSTIANHVLSVRFKPGWNHLKVIDETGAQDSRLVFAVVK